MARKLPTFDRILGGEAIMAIVYAEISSSLYFALGIVSLWALGLTPLVLILVGLLFGLAPALQSTNPDINESLKENALRLAREGRAPVSEVIRVASELGD